MTSLSDLPGSNTPSYEDLLELIPDKYKATVYTPTVERVTCMENDGDFDKFGGIPSVEKEFKWPQCRVCGTKMTFFFQLTSPIEEMTVQMFHCLGAGQKYYCKGFDKGNASYIRYIDYKDYTVTNCTERDTTIYEDTSKNGAFKCYRVTAWQPQVELKNWRAVEQLLPDYIRRQVDWEAWGFQSKEETKELHDDVYDLYWNHRIDGFKFGGDGSSAQMESYPGYMLHFEKTDYLPHMWDDCGYAHISTDLKFVMDSH